MKNSLSERIDHCLDKTISMLRGTQDEQGRWMGAARGIDTIFYAIALALEEEPPSSAVVQDLCDYIESCQTDEGGIGDYPGEPANGFATCFVLPILKWGRPQSATIAGAEAYLKRTLQWWHNDPRMALVKWACQPELRDKVVADKGPPAWVRKIGLAISKRHSSVRVPAHKAFPRKYHKLSLKDRLIMPTLIRSMTYPPLDELEEFARVAPLPTGLDIMLLVHAGMLKLANDTSYGAQRLYEFAKSRRSRFIFDDGLYEWLSVLTADLFFTKAMGMEKEHKNASDALRTLRYEGGGWISGDMVTIHVFDTALLVLALRAADISPDDDMLRRATEYLKLARSPEHGMWAWGYTEGMGDKRPYADTDDTGLVLAALVKCGERKDSEIMNVAIESLFDMQDPGGEFSVFHGVLRPNWAWISNTSRALMGLVACGFSTKDSRVARAAQWLLSQQLPDGSWVDWWCSRYIYGTVTALEALLQADSLTQSDPRTKAALQWLLKEQNADGGWGENWAGGNSSSTCEHTGLAVYGLCIASPSETMPVDAIEKGVEWLLAHQREDGTWDSIYHMNFGFGVGMSDAALPNVWAIHALAYARKVLPLSVEAAIATVK